ncbi:hypothetical protein [Spiroplasma endosymbiont of Andrena trimmerana]|uniref:hypothetical protein n=1 Tax=Spiroplasma endosymbiont of Andrena trimmerana TaxID=3066316 RepID=UPI0030CEA218
MDKDQFKYAFSINTIGTEIPNLETTDKTVAGAINEIIKKQPQPQPIPPSSSIWKEVGIREKNKWDNWQITYDFIVNKRYKVYYSWNIYNNVFAIKEFIITNTKIAGVPIEVFNNNTNVLVLSVQHSKFITIYSLKGSDKGNTWKLEELQE